MNLDPKMSVSSFLRKISRRLDGMLLVGLVISYVLFAVFPGVPVHLGLLGNYGAAQEMRVAFGVMPFVLVGLYLWFFTSAGKGPHSWLLCFVLCAAAVIPFLKTLRESF